MTSNDSWQSIINDLEGIEKESPEYFEIVRSRVLPKLFSFLKDNNNQALKQLENLSVISGSQAESIKKSLENIGAKDAYIQNLQSAINKKDSLNMALVMNLKGAIGNLDD